MDMLCIVFLCRDIMWLCFLPAASPMGFPTLATAFVVSGAAVVCAVKGTTCVAKGPVDSTEGSASCFMKVHMIYEFMWGTHIYSV